MYGEGKFIPEDSTVIMIILRFFVIKGFTFAIMIIWSEILGME